jgi:hypothetical protein
MESVLAQIGIIAAGVAAGSAIVMVGSAGRMRSALHRPRPPENYHPQTYYHTMERPSYPNYQPSGHHHHRQPYSHYR